MNSFILKINQKKFYSENDYICNYLGTRDMLNTFVWPGQKDFVAQSVTFFRSAFDLESLKLERAKLKPLER